MAISRRGTMRPLEPQGRARARGVRAGPLCSSYLVEREREREREKHLSHPPKAPITIGGPTGRGV